ncbi:RloB family protein [Escherichia sp. E13S3]|uniref:RloB family protein n=1 Tax=Escherichia sp. E13S3 TaxID=2484854 RepID=UPI001028AC08|nr:RloB family protein [Escherichia sp. E13S3]RZN49741.1 RloB domain-containing protein [Escherichia sp. E13S3]
MARDDFKNRRKPKSLSSFRRKGQTRSPYLKVLIICEGSKTEPNYFEEIREYYSLNSANVEISGECGSNPMSVVNFAKEVYKKHRDTNAPFDRVFCVIDRDAHPDYQTAKETVRQLTPYGVYEIIDSVPCFEFWLLLHHEYTAASFERLSGNSAGNQVLTRLKSHMPDYGKGSKKIFTQLLEKLPDAMKHANRLEKAILASGVENPATKVHKLVDFLQKLNQPEMLKKTA